MPKNAERYSYRLIWSEDDREFVGLCPEFPSLSWLGASQGEALRGIMNLVAKAMADMKRRGEIPPAPLSGRRYSGRFLVRVPPEVHRDLAIRAAEEGISLNRLVSAKLSRE